MKTTNEILDLLREFKRTSGEKYGIEKLALFGSAARGEQREGSDVDVCVEMEPSAYLLVRLKRFLESLLGCSVDVVRMHKHINPYLLKEIENDGIYVIQ